MIRVSSGAINTGRMKDRIKGTIKVKWRELEWFQPEALKTPDSIGKLKTSLKKNGMLDAFKIWRRGKRMLILDGHYRQKAMLELEAEGEPIPDEFTANILDIKNEREAKKVVMACNSHYARVNGDAMLDFIGDDFSFGELSAEFEIPGFDWGFTLDRDEGDSAGASPWSRVGEAGDGVMFSFGEVQARLPEETADLFAQKVTRENLHEWIIKALNT